jgi:hypothetical protein
VGSIPTLFNILFAVVYAVVRDFWVVVRVRRDLGGETPAQVYHPLSLHRCFFAGLEHHFSCLHMFIRLDFTSQPPNASLWPAFR